MISILMLLLLTGSFLALTGLVRFAENIIQPASTAATTRPTEEPKRALQP